jgi:hypothetical protein
MGKTTLVAFRLEEELPSAACLARPLRTQHRVSRFDLPHLLSSGLVGRLEDVMGYQRSSIA